jgi:membrane protein YqaA with SNARE-associated domain
VKISPVALLSKWNAMMLAALKPLGVWGIGALALIDSSTIPVPIDALLIDYVANDHKRFLLYCFMAAFGSAVGSLLPYYLGRAGGELFLLKRINRQRYEQMRDRFEKQEFLAIMVPAMMPPPMPVKLFEFAAGVFEMKPQWFFSAILVGKFVRFLIWAIITITYGPAILGTITRTIQVYVLRKVFDRRRGKSLPVEED